MATYLLDTNHMGNCLHPVSRLRDRVRAEIRAGHRLGTCVPVLCEVHVFVHGSRDQQQRRRFLRETLRSIRIWPVDPPLADFYADIFYELRSAGRLMSQVDMMLAAMARWKKCTLLTSDRDFEALPDIPCENWLN